MIALHAGRAEALIVPERGAFLARLSHGGRDLLAPMPDGAEPNTGFHGSFVMAPWTNRLDEGRIVVAGREWRMPLNRPAERTAIHGFLREHAWQVEARDASRIVLACRFDSPPFHGAARLEAHLAEDGLSLELALSNEAPVATPMGFGWHPYFPRPAGTRLHATAGVVFGRDARTLPVAPRRSAGLRGADAALDGLDTHFAAWDGRVELAWPDGRSLQLLASGAWSANLQVFAPRGAGVIAVEPVSHAPDAANRPHAAAHGAMHLLPPRGTLRGSLMIHWR